MTGSTAGLGLAAAAALIEERHQVALHARATVPGQCPDLAHSRPVSLLVGTKMSECRFSKPRDPFLTTFSKPFPPLE
jgi:hypothetical protein